MRLIDADALGKKVHDWATDEWNAELLPYWVKDDLEDFIEDAPTVDVEKHGHWIYERITNTNGSSYSVVWCSNCQAHTPWVVKYCPCCGAKMDEVKNEID